jgi:hypothetical protein
MLAAHHDVEPHTALAEFLDVGDINGAGARAGVDLGQNPTNPPFGNVNVLPPADR